MAGQGIELADDFNVAALLLLTNTAGQKKWGSLQLLAQRETPKEPFIEGDPGVEEPLRLLQPSKLAVAVPPLEELDPGQRSSFPTPKNRQTTENLLLVLDPTPASLLHRLRLANPTEIARNLPSQRMSTLRDGGRRKGRGGGRMLHETQKSFLKAPL
jgi:hypothetical protein